MIHSSKPSETNKVEIWNKSLTNCVWPFFFSSSSSSLPLFIHHIFHLFFPLLSWTSLKMPDKNSSRWKLHLILTLISHVVVLKVIFDRVNSFGRCYIICTVLKSYKKKTTLKCQRWMIDSIHVNVFSALTLVFCRIMVFISKVSELLKMCIYSTSHTTVPKVWGASQGCYGM